MSNIKESLSEFSGEIKNQLRSELDHGTILIRWGIMAAVIGFVVGGIASLFAKCLIFVNEFRAQNPGVIYLLPVLGLVIVFLYNRLGLAKDPGTNRIISTINKGKPVPGRLAPLIFVSTVLTQLGGGSAGREGAALQIGGTIGYHFGHAMEMDWESRRILVLCGMSAAFSAVFGTPIAAVVFPMELVMTGGILYIALMPCMVASLVASLFAANMGIAPERFEVIAFPPLTPENLLKVIAFAVGGAILSVIMCEIFHLGKKVSAKWIQNPYLRVVAGGAILVAVTKIFSTADYLGAGINLIEKSMLGEIPGYAFLVKILLTALTLGVGFKGGEIVPTLAVGAAFGGAVAEVLGVNPALGAALGMTSLFCGATDCPLATLLLSFELFGYQGAIYYLITCCISYLMSGSQSLYKNQNKIYSKYNSKWKW